MQFLPPVYYLAFSAYWIHFRDHGGEYNIRTTILSWDFTLVRFGQFIRFLLRWSICKTSTNQELVASNIRQLRTYNMNVP